MPDKIKYDKYIFSSQPLLNIDFDSFIEDGGIFRLNFYNHTFRKRILYKLQHNIEASNGGVILLSGYRGTGKTSFLNYVFYKLDKEKKQNYLHDTFNLSSLSSGDLKFEIISRIIRILSNRRNEFSAPIRSKIKELEETLRWERSFGEKKSNSYSLNIGNKAGNQSGIEAGIKLDRGKEKSIQKKLKDNIYYLEDELRDTLKVIGEKEGKKVVLAIDELDKYPLSIPSQTSSNNYQRMEWLLRLLSETKYFLFESGVVFILVVNKDIFDHWRYRYSQADLFMNLVTNVYYMPCYFKEEMELEDNFIFSFDQEIKTLTPFSSYTLKKYFNICAYYESFANPRLYFQYLANRLSNGEISISRNDAASLQNKLKLYELNEILYGYFYENSESSFKRLFSSMEGLIAILAAEVPARKDYIALISQYRDYFIKNYNIDFFTSTFTSGKNARKDVEEFYYMQFQAFTNIIAEKDKADNFPLSNYLIRRLTDFQKIIEERHYIRIIDILEEMRFEEFEIKDSIGKYLITLLIPINILLLLNNRLLSIKAEFLNYQHQYDFPKSFFQDACRHELNISISESYKSYNRLIAEKQDFVEIMHRKFRLFFYMLVLGYYDKNISIKEEWLNDLRIIQDHYRDQKLVEKGEENANTIYWTFIYNILFENQGSGGVKINPEPVDKNRAMQIYKEVIEHEPMNASIYSWKGYFHFWEEEYAASLDLFHKSLELEYDPTVIIRVGDIYSKQKNYPEAIHKYIEVIESDSSWLNKALVLLSISNLVEEGVAQKELAKNMERIHSFLYNFIGMFDFTINHYFIFEKLKGIVDRLAGEKTYLLKKKLYGIYMDKYSDNSTVLDEAKNETSKFNFVRRLINL